MLDAEPPALAPSLPPPKSTLPLFATAGRSQLGDPISSSGFEFSSNFRHMVWNSALLNSLLVVQSNSTWSTSSASGLSEESFTKPPIPSQCRLSSHCCCYCWYSPLLQALLVAPRCLFGTPCCSTGAPVTYFSSQTTLFKWAVNHWQASPGGCNTGALIPTV